MSASSAVILVLMLVVRASTQQTESAKTMKQVYRVTTIQDFPFLMVDQSSSNGRYRGLIVDIMDELASILNIAYEFQLVNDRRYGGMGHDGNWSGMVGELVRGEADLAASAMTITSIRSKVVDFAHPYMSSPLKILLKYSNKKVKVPVGLFLVAPLREGVWVAIAASFVVTCIGLVVISKWSPYENVKAGKSQIIVIQDRLLSVFSSLTWQGNFKIPASISGRILACFWWIFVVLTIVTYIGNMTAQLLAKPADVRQYAFRSYSDLVSSKHTTIGVVAGGSTMAYFRNGNSSYMRKRIWSKIAKKAPFGLTKSYREGIARVRNSNGSYVFIMEGPAAMLAAGNEPCELSAVGRFQRQRVFGLACRKGSGLCSLLDIAILQMIDDDFIYDTSQKWLSGPCTPSKDRIGGNLSTEVPISLLRFAAALVLITIGIFAAGIILLIELYWVRKYGQMF